MEAALTGAPGSRGHLTSHCWPMGIGHCPQTVFEMRFVTCRISFMTAPRSSLEFSNRRPDDQPRCRPSRRDSQPRMSSVDQSPRRPGELSRNQYRQGNLPRPETVRRYRVSLDIPRVSTCEVYGDGHNQGRQPLTNTAEPAIPYGAGRRPTACYSYFRSYGPTSRSSGDSVHLRRRQKAGRFGALIPRLVRQRASNGEG